MGKVYLNQTKLRLEVDTETDCTGATEVLIKYKKPSGTTGSFAAALAADKRTLVYEFSSESKFDEAKKWILWAHVVFADGRSAPGEPVDVVVYEEGK